MCTSNKFAEEDTVLPTHNDLTMTNDEIVGTNRAFVTAATDADGPFAEDVIVPFSAGKVHESEFTNVRREYSR